jgi:homoserine kinase type II
MAVFTSVDEDTAQGLLDTLGLGRLHSLTGIPAGIENSNFFLDCDAGRFVLTLFERLTHAQLPFYLGLMQHLAAKGLPVPAPQADAAGRSLFTLEGKPAAVVTRLRGAHQLAPTASTASSSATRWRACTWRWPISRCGSPICAAWPGGSRPCRPC